MRINVFLALAILSMD